MRLCSIVGCDRKHYGNGFCQMHNRRNRENGNPTVARSYGTTTCSVENCDQDHHARGFCSKHRNRVWRHGDPLAGGPERDHGPVVARIKSRVVVNTDTGCWDWPGSTDSSGYGQVSVGARVLRGTHIVTYEHAHGPTPEGLVLDHLCERPICCNPNHLEPVTRAENLRRAVEGRN